MLKSFDKIENQTFRFLCGLLGLWLLVWSSVSSFPITPLNTHCPNAKFEDKECSTHFNKEGRAIVPDSGTKGFVQCQCAEKVASYARDSLSALVAIDLPCRLVIEGPQEVWTEIFLPLSFLSEPSQLQEVIDPPPQSLA